MKSLLEMIECSNDSEIEPWQHTRSPERFKGMSECFEVVRPFVLTQGKPCDEELGGSFIPYSIEIDMPFKVCSFENLKTEIVINLKSDTVKAPVIASCIMVRENKPRDYSIYVYDRTRNMILGVDKHGSYGNELEIYVNILKHIKEEYLDRLKTSDIGQAQTNKKVKILSSSGKKIREIKKVVIIGGSGHKLRKLNGAKISWDYSHRWEVRGHWRKCRGLGKNRDGIYSVDGYTWVKPHEKGPEDGIKIKKTRVLK